MHLVYTPDISDSERYTLSEEESKHCIRVMRLSVGSPVGLIDGKGGWFDAEIIDDNPKKCVVKITAVKQEFGKRAIHIHIAVAPTKNMDRIEWFAEKATELGMEELSLIVSNNSERSKLKIERLEKIAIAAIKQSQKAYLPKINEPLSFEKFIATVKNIAAGKFIAHCREGFSKNKNHLKEWYKKGENAIILIGPEGDFTTEEIQLALDNGFKEISLGESRLRTETAALYGCSIVNMIND
ncbi:Ribosomal RNA small subunit methyltransferase E [sediment metagenome]|uniref:16S rRNA (uracil(1498)-N(3))-methyltransferase n=1 Tax=sediment metagenome TaxID=749907 RepID=D9PHT5_9ZZZZ